VTAPVDLILSIVALDAYTPELAKINAIAKTAELWSLLKSKYFSWSILKVSRYVVK